MLRRSLVFWKPKKSKMLTRPIFATQATTPQTTPPTQPTAKEPLVLKIPPPKAPGWSPGSGDRKPAFPSAGSSSPSPDPNSVVSKASSPSPNPNPVVSKAKPEVHPSREGGGGSPGKIATIPSRDRSWVYEGESATFRWFRSRTGSNLLFEVHGLNLQAVGLREFHNLLRQDPRVREHLKKSRDPESDKRVERLLEEALMVKAPALTVEKMGVNVCASSGELVLDCGMTEKWIRGRDAILEHLESKALMKALQEGGEEPKKMVAGLRVTLDRTPPSTPAWELLDMLRILLASHKSSGRNQAGDTDNKSSETGATDNTVVNSTVDLAPTHPTTTIRGDIQTARPVMHQSRSGRSIHFSHVSELPSPRRYELGSLTERRTLQRIQVAESMVGDGVIVAPTPVPPAPSDPSLPVVQYTIRGLTPRTARVESLKLAYSLSLAEFCDKVQTDEHAQLLKQNDVVENMEVVLKARRCLAALWLGSAVAMGSRRISVQELSRPQQS
eukprot:Hpha_TRINITY_DN22515_c0_g1::TRINITY_DN22515_c0_g1_i1::g.184991::m.184991